MSGVVGPDDRLAAGLGAGGLGPSRAPQQQTNGNQRVSPEVPVTSGDQQYLGVPPGSTKQKFDTGDGTQPIYRYTTPSGEVIIVDGQGNILQRSAPQTPAPAPSPSPSPTPQPTYQPDNSQYFTPPGWRPEQGPPRYNPDYFVK